MEGKHGDKEKSSELRPGSERSNMNSDRQSTKVSDSNRTKFRNAVLINTIMDGYNSGRAYYLQAETEEVCRELAKTLAVMSKDAKKRAEAKTRFQKMQGKVLKFYESTPFQCLVAFLIVAVRSSLR
jgi:hypothetical protein